MTLVGTGEKPSFRSGNELTARLASPEPLLSVELRPPRLTPGSGQGLEGWLDLHHAITRLLGAGALVFTTDSATGTPEEESLRHLRANLGPHADFSRLVPFLTTKHSLDYCLRFPARAAENGHRALVVLGGDRHDGLPRCVEHASELRALLADRYPGLALGGWANPYRDPAWQIDLLKAGERVSDFALTQIVSHHDLARVEAFLVEAERQKLTTPLVFGVFYWRNARPDALAALARLLPVPAEGLGREFGVEGLDAQAVCRRTLKALGGLGIRRVYLSNLPLARAASLYQQLREAFGADV